MGLIIFLILVIINFVVITKGSGRIAEVAARFTLDAMPGKQMSIDADLNAGMIDDQEARRRRELISREAEFYGAMDGASKFVRGEAVAALLMILVNIGGGFAIGVIQHRLPFLKALETYTILTIGDALVAQIPGPDHLRDRRDHRQPGCFGTQHGKGAGQTVQTPTSGDPPLGGNPLLMGLIPGLPHLPFIALSLATGFLGSSVGRKRNRSWRRSAWSRPRKWPCPPRPSRWNPF